jgi:methionine-rich copper-binding protein CopC
MGLLRTFSALCVFALPWFWFSIAGGHVFLVAAEPGAGSVLKGSPPHIRIWFDGALKPAACVIHVENGEGQRVDRDDSRVSPKDPRLLEASLPLLPSGKYRVIWHVKAADGHQAEGDFFFTIQAGD